MKSMDCFPLWLALLTLSGCADPAPAPPPPHVSGLDDYLSGAQAYQTGDYDKAQILLEKAVQQNPDMIVVHQLLGDTYRKETDYSRASDQYESFVRLDPYNFKSHYDLGLAYQLLGRLEAAAEAYLHALILSPRDLNTNMNLGLVYLALGRTNDAVAQLQKTVSINPRSAAAQCNLGVALETAGQLGKAELAYNRAIELDPSQMVALVNLGSNLVSQDRGREAAVVLSVAVRRVNTPAVHKRLGDALVLAREDDNAMREYQAALKLDAQYWPAMNQIGMIYIRKYQEGMTLDEDLRLSAVAIWRQSLSIRPDQPQIKQLAAYWNQNGRVVP
jgi:protein O-GlcNAc transferase